ALANAKVHERDIALATQLEEALASRAIIDQAKGIIMARDRCTAEEAFDSLRVASQAANRKLRDIARDVVDGAASTRASEEDPNR
ncbi:MAG: ANTAR domain-containing protein, partial [Actinobacteria bacterium]